MKFSWLVKEVDTSFTKHKKITGDRFSVKYFKCSIEEPPDFSIGAEKVECFEFFGNKHIVMIFEIVLKAS